MMLLRLISALAVVAALYVPAASADEKISVSHNVSGSFEDVVFDLENAIVDEGLVIDYRGYLNAMLERTSETVGAATDGAKSPYIDATYMHFCSAALTHAAVSADPANVSICPYVVFAYELRSDPGTVVAGYRRPVAGTSPASLKALGDIEALLDKIVMSATGN